MKILGVETSCDETSAAVVVNGAEILCNVVSSQVALHRPYGGVVPELASRNHLQWIDSVVEQALSEAHTSIDEIDAVAATYGPGLASSLLIGLNAAKGIAFAAGKPFAAINHVEAHLYSPLFANAAQDAPADGFAGRVRGTYDPGAMRQPSGRMRFSARPSMTPPGRRLTRSPSCWILDIPAARRFRNAPRAETPGPLIFRAACCTTAATISASVA